jgi:hypothetical protein
VLHVPVSAILVGEPEQAVRRFSAAAAQTRRMRIARRRQVRSLGEPGLDGPQFVISQGRGVVVVR